MPDKSLEERFAPIDPTVPGQFPDTYRPPAIEPNTIPTVEDTVPGTVTPDRDMSIRLRRGIVAEVKVDGDKPYMIQNVNENEDDLIEFSFHGDPKGIWNKLYPGGSVIVNRTIFFLNRTSKDTLYLAATFIRIN
jgi:hypothetical protein